MQMLVQNLVVATVVLIAIAYVALRPSRERLSEALVARFVEVEYQYAAFRGFDMHENGKTRMEEMKKQIDRPIGTLIRELKERGVSVDSAGFDAAMGRPARTERIGTSVRSAPG